MFERIAVPGFTDGLIKGAAQCQDSYPENYLHELEWLFERGIIFEPEETADSKLARLDDEYKHLLKAELYHRNKFKRLLKKEGIVKLAQTGKLSSHLHVFGQNTSRRIGVILRRKYGMDVYPIFNRSLYPEENSTADKSVVVQIVLRALPIPYDSTSWEQIIEYRDDPEGKGKFLGLRNWMNDIARAKLSPLEIEDKLEWLISDYQRHLNLHKIKVNPGVLQVIIVTGAELLENIVKFNWGKAAKKLFSFQQRKIELIEGELKSPGNEVAYIFDARQRFLT